MYGFHGKQDSRKEGCFPTAWIAEQKDTDCGSVVVVHFERACRVN